MPEISLFLRNVHVIPAKIHRHLCEGRNPGVCDHGPRLPGNDKVRGVTRLAGCEA